MKYIVKNRGWQILKVMSMYCMFWCVAKLIDINICTKFHSLLEAEAMLVFLAHNQKW
jgi:hypothetical protein